MPLLIAATSNVNRRQKRGERLQSGGVICLISHYPLKSISFSSQKNFYTKMPFNMCLLFPPLFILSVGKSQSKQENPSSVFFFFTTPSVYLLQLLPLHYHIWYSLCIAQEEFSFCLRQGAASATLQRSRSGGGLSKFHAQVYGHIWKSIRANKKIKKK